MIASELAAIVGDRPHSRDLARQMRHQEGDMKAAGEKAEMQPPIAALGGGFAELLAQAQSSVRGRGWCRARSNCRRAAASGKASGRVSSVAPATPIIAPTQPTPRIAACTTGAKTNCPSEPPALMIPAAQRAPLAGHALHHRADQDRQAAGAGAERADDAERRDQRPFRMNERRHRGAERQHDPAKGDDPAGAEAVGQRAEHRLRKAPDKLADRHRQADRRRCRARSRRRAGR